MIIQKNAVANILRIYGLQIQPVAFGDIDREVDNAICRFAARMAAQGVKRIKPEHIVPGLAGLSPSPALSPQPAPKDTGTEAESIGGECKRCNDLDPTGIYVGRVVTNNIRAQVEDQTRAELLKLNVL